MVRRPLQLDFSLQVFLTIFKPRVWLATLISFLVIVIMYHISIAWNHRQRESWCTSVVTVFGYFTMSTSRRHLTRSPQYILTSWSVFSLLFTTMLSSGIVTRLTIPLYSPRVDTLQQLVEQGYYWTFHNYVRYKESSKVINTFFNLEHKWTREFEKTYRFINASEVCRIAAIDKKLTFPVQMYREDILLTLCLTDLPVIRKLRVTKEVITETHTSFGVKKHSPLLEPLTEITHRFLEVGLLDYWKNDLIRRFPMFNTKHILIEQDVPTFSEPHPLRLYKVQPVFYLLLFGLAVAVVVFIVELKW